MTGPDTPVGSATLDRLGALDDVRAVPVEAPTTDPSLAGRLDGLDVLVHPLPGEQVVRAAATVLTASAAARVARVVLVTSAAVYGAFADNPVPLDEDGPLRAQPDAPEARDLLEVEELAQRAQRTHPGLAVSVVRPASLVGPGIATAVAGHFAAPRLLVVRGTRPRWQFCHVDDLADALVLAALGRARGILTAGAEGWLEQEQVEALSGLRRVELPASLAFSTAERLHRLGVIPGPAADLSYVVHPWVVPSTRLRAAGWRPAYDNETAFGLLLEQLDAEGSRGRRDATLGAAGAAVAVVGTAALVRRARKRRRG